MRCLHPTTNFSILPNKIITRHHFTDHFDYTEGQHKFAILAQIQTFDHGYFHTLEQNLNKCFKARLSSLKHCQTFFFCYTSSLQTDNKNMIFVPKSQGFCCWRNGYFDRHPLDFYRSYVTRLIISALDQCCAEVFAYKQFL